MIDDRKEHEEREFRTLERVQRKTQDVIERLQKCLGDLVSDHATGSHALNKLYDLFDEATFDAGAARDLCGELAEMVEEREDDDAAHRDAFDADAPQMRE